MYTEAFDALALDGISPSEVSTPVEVPPGETAAQLQAVVYAINGSGPPQVTYELQQANDKGDWESVAGSAVVASRVGYSKSAPVYGLTSGLVRLRATLTGTDASAVLSAGFNLARP